MDWIPQIKPKEPEVLKVKNKPLKNSMMEKSDESSSESELKHSQSAPMDGFNINNIFEFNSSNGSPKNKRHINLNKYRRAIKSNNPREIDEIHSMVDDITDNNSDDNFRTNLKGSKTLKSKNKISQRRSKIQNANCIKVVDASYIQSKMKGGQISKNKGMFGNQMMKYMLKSEESDEFSFDSSFEEQVNIETQGDKKTPGLFIK